MKYFSLQYMIKAFLSALYITTYAANMNTSSSQLTSACIPALCNGDISSPRCDQCSYCDNINGIYTPAAIEITNSSVHQPHNRTHKYIYYTYESDKTNTNIAEYMCVPWIMSDCNSVPQKLSDENIIVRTSALLYTQEQDKYVPMSITYNQYTEDNNVHKGMYIYSLLPIISAHNENNSVTQTIQTDYILPLMEYKGSQYSVNEGQHTSNVSVLGSAICQGQQICYRQALQYLVTNNLCWIKEKVECVQHHAMTGRQILGYHYYHKINLTKSDIDLYNAYYNVPRFMNLSCDQISNGIEYISKAIYEAHNVPTNNHLIITRATINATQTATSSTLSTILPTTIPYIQSKNPNILGIILGTMFGLIPVITAIIGFIVYKYRIWLSQTTSFRANEPRKLDIQGIDETQEQAQSFIQTINIDMNMQQGTESEDIDQPDADYTVSIV